MFTESGLSCYSDGFPVIYTDASKLGKLFALRWLLERSKKMISIQLSIAGLGIVIAIGNLAIVMAILSLRTK